MKSVLAGSVVPPPSKSHSIRALILAALSDGGGTIENLLESADIFSAISCLKTLGVRFVKTSDAVSNFYKVVPPPEGIASYAEGLKKTIILEAGNSGTLLYFLPMIAAAVSAHFVFMGDESLKRRPVKPITEILDCLGIQYKTQSESSFSAPIEIFGKKILSKKNVRADGKFSQPISGLLIASAVFYFFTEINLKVAGELPYIKMTLKRLKDAGVNVNVSEDFKKFSVCGGQRIRSPYTFIPSDWSSAAFLLLAAVASNSHLKIKKMNLLDSQGDSAIFSFLKKMNAGIFYNEEEMELEIMPIKDSLKAGEFDLSFTPDLFPVMAGIALFANGKTVLKNIEICRSKECDRIKAVTEELTKLGGEIIEGKDFVEINGKGGANLKCAVTDSRADHRIAMMLACTSLGIKPSSTDSHVRIKNFECFAVSYPQFISSLKKLGAKVFIT